MKRLILDVGCGKNFKGDINIDLYIEKTFHRFNDSTLDVKHIPNFIKASAINLPFRDNVFDLVITSHCLEHIEKFKEMFKELFRVSCFMVKIIIPSRYSDSGLKRLVLIKNKKYSHINFFTKQGLKDLCILSNINNYEIRTSDTKKIQFKHYTFFRLPISREITFEGYKTTKDI
jgi:SAM-dependent methyltransferase